ncbi:MAG: PaaI family thioesterase [Litorimonas sp.]|uniref:PaaI family thioesterase n=1 Tax=Tateyamaria sp. TaxID=1929288 RepID=UPI00329D4983
MTQSLTDELIDSIPYAKTLGIKAEFKEGSLLLILPYLQSNIGNPTLPALHGGAIGGFMEVCAMAELRRRSPELPFSKPIGINIDYLRRGKPVETFARADIFKEGSRVSNVRVRAWQESEDKPIAALSGHFLLPKKP